MTIYLKDKGYTCKGVVGGLKGVEELEKYIPTLILLEIFLSDLSGFELCKTIKSDIKLKNIPVLFFTVLPRLEVNNRMADTMADGYILKPFDLEDLNVLFEYM